MTNDYPFLTASLISTPSTFRDQALQLAQTNQDRMFDLATDVFTIEEEYPMGSEQYQPLFVRVDHVINSDTGEKRGDDYKKLLFKNLQQVVQPGQQYRFANNIWLTYATESIATSGGVKSLIKQCNNVLRWIDADGSLNEVPCSVTEIIKQTRDYSTAGSSLVIPAGFFEILCQFNPRSNKIKSNQRFLLGNSGFDGTENNWFCFRVHGAGVQNYRNLQTYDNMSPGILRIIVGANFIGEQTDDLVRGIADFYKSIYSLSIDNSNVIGNIGRKIQLTATLLLNGQTTNKSLTWASDNENVAKIDPSTGLLTMIGIGACEITCSITDNPDRIDSIIVTCSGAPVLDYEVVISPNKNFILQGMTEVYDVRLWLNGVVQSNTFVFTLDGNTVPTANYQYSVIGGNSFSVKNIKMFLTDSININCVSGSFSKSIDINLRMAF